MGNYTSGLITQEKIVNSAKRLFYEFGYKKTTIKAICEDAKVLRTVFVYYFKDKAEIADFISNLMNSALMNALMIELRMKDEALDELVFNIYSSAWFFIKIMSDININRFYAEVLGSNSNMLLGDAFYRSLFKKMYRACGKNTESKEFELFFTYNTSPPGAFLNQYLEGLVDLTKEEIAEFMSRQVLSGLSIEGKRQEDIIETVLSKVQESKINFKEIFLSPYVNPLKE
ncbi:MAG: TetR/AcrR family transcriptional regulator [Eubacteriales bacterium]